MAIRDRPRPAVVALILAVALLAAGRLPAAEKTGSDAPVEGDTSDLEQRILEEQHDRELRVLGIGRLRLSHPQRWSMGVGFVAARQPTSYDCTSVCDFKGLVAQAEPGYSGGQLSIGYAALTAETGRGRRFLSNVFLGYSVKAALLRTWNGADLTPANQTLAGAEAEFTIIRVNFSVGVFREIGSADPRDPWVVGGGIGWGF